MKLKKLRNVESNKKNWTELQNKKRKREKRGKRFRTKLNKPCKILMILTSKVRKVENQRKKMSPTMVESEVWQARHLLKDIVALTQFKNCSLKTWNLSQMKKIKLLFILYTVKSTNYKSSSQFLKKGKQIQNSTILFTRIFWACMIFPIEKRSRVSMLLSILELN